MRTIKLFLDDRLNPPDDTWTLVRTAEDALLLLDDPSVDVECASLDHDLGQCAACEGSGDRPDAPANCRHKMTGYDLVKWMAENDVWPRFKPAVHSANPVGRANMIATIERYWTLPGAEVST